MKCNKTGEKVKLGGNTRKGESPVTVSVGNQAKEYVCLVFWDFRQCLHAEFIVARPAWSVWLALADRFLGPGWLLSGVVDAAIPAIRLVNWTIAVSPTGHNRTPRISLKP